jgi:hypothetical protein
VVAISLRAALDRILAMPDLAGLSGVKPRAKAEPNPKKRTRDGDEEEGDYAAGTFDGYGDSDGYSSKQSSPMKRPPKRQVRTLNSFFSLIFMTFTLL